MLIQGDDMSERIQALKTQLAETREYLNKVLDAVGDRWQAPVYTEGLEWTVQQALNHLADSDRGHNLQAMSIANGRDLIPEDFDIERYNRGMTRKTAEKTVEEARIDLADAHRKLLKWLDTLNDSALDMKGRHATLRIMTVEELLLFQSMHVRGHVDDIAKSLDIDV
jgi:hypothetical protein